MEILAMWKALESTVPMKDGKKVIALCIVVQNYGRFVILLDHFRNFRGIYLILEYNIENEEGIIIQWKKHFCSKLKKGKLKTKKLVKITILGEQEHSVQSTDNQKNASLTLMKCVFNKTWKMTITTSVAIWK